MNLIEEYKDYKDGKKTTQMQFIMRSKYEFPIAVEINHYLKIIPEIALINKDKFPIIENRNEDYNYYYCLLEISEDAVKIRHYSLLIADIVNILLSFTFQSFKIDSDPQFSSPVTLSEDDVDLDKINKEISGKLNHLITRLLEISIEQYRIIQCSLHYIRIAIHLSETYVAQAFLYLIASVEILSGKYLGELPSISREPKTFLDKLKKLLEKEMDNKKPEEINELGKKIDKIHKDFAFNPIKARYVKFCMKFLSTEYHNELLEQFIRDLYDFRSFVVHHGGQFFFPPSLNSYSYQLPTHSGKNLRMAKIDGIDVPILYILPSFDWLKQFTFDIFFNFTNELIKSTDDVLEIAAIDKLERGVRSIVADRDIDNGEKVPMDAIKHKEYYLILHNLHLQTIDANKLIEEGKRGQAKDILNKILESPYFNEKYEVFEEAKELLKGI